MPHRRDAHRRDAHLRHNLIRSALSLGASAGPSTSACPGPALRRPLEGLPGPMQPLLHSYAPILLLLGLVLGFAAVNLVLSELMGRKRRAIGKGSAYECGMGSIGNARLRLSIHFYLVAVLFILFDVESLLLIPWAVTAKSFAAAGVGGVVFAEICVFVAVLGVGLAFVWRKGGLTWDR